MPSSPRVEIAPGIFAESVVKHARTPDAEPYEVYRVSGGVFDQFELDSMASLAHLIGILSSFGRDELRSLGEEPPHDGYEAHDGHEAHNGHQPHDGHEAHNGHQPHDGREPHAGQEPPAGGEDFIVGPAFADRRAERLSALDRGHRRTELELPATAPAAAAHRRFACDAGAPRRARIWAAETLGDCLPDTEWSVSLLEQTVLQASELVGEAVQAGASAVLVTLEIDDRRLALTRFDEFPGAGQALA